MRVIRLAALIATAQVALVVILFTFGYSVAHAGTIYSQPTHSTLDSANCYDNGTGSFCDLFNGSQKRHFEYATTTSNWNITASTTLYADLYMGMDGASWGSYVSAPPSSPYIQVVVGSCTFSHNLTTTERATLIATTLSTPALFTAIPLVNTNMGCTSPVSGTAYNFGWGGGNWNGQMAAYTDNTSAHLKDYFVLTDGSPNAPANGLSFIRVLPTTGTTTPTTSVEFKAMYYVASTTIEATAGHGGFGLSSTKYYLNLTRLDVASSSQWFIGNGAGNDKWNILDTTITLTASSTWRGVWTSYDSLSPYPTYQQSDYFNFSVQSNTLLSSLGIAGYEQIPSLSSASTTAIAPAPCGITDISGCFQNALVFLFYPSTASLDQYSTLWTLVKNKPPFGYVVAVQTAVGTLSASSTATFNLGTVPFMASIFDPFRTAVAVLMWLVFIVAFYHRLSTLDI